MANNPSEAATDDFLEQILGIPTFASVESGLTGNDGGLSAAHGSMMLQLSSGDGSGHMASVGGGFRSPGFPLGLSLEQGKCGFLKPERHPEAASGSAARSSMAEVSYKLFSKANQLPAMLLEPHILRQCDQE